jgi:hypothetical protein
VLNWEPKVNRSEGLKLTYLHYTNKMKHHTA